MNQRLQYITLALGILLILLGLAGYLLSNKASLTAFIPSLFGLVLLICGLFALKENWKMHAMHVAVLVALLGFAGTFSAIPALFNLLMGEEVARPQAVKSKSVMAVLCLIFLGMAISSFIKARKQSK